MSSTNINFKIRNARKEDAEAIVRMVKQLCDMEGKKCYFTTKKYLACGFGKTKLFSTIVALIEKKVIGYASFHYGYDLESATKGIYLIDLFVLQEFRNQKLGAELMNVLGQKCKATGCQ